MFLIILVGLLSGIFLYFVLVKREPRNGVFSKIPSLPWYPVIGSALLLNVPHDDLYHWQFRIRGEYGKRYIFYSLGYYCIILSDPDDVEKLLSSSVHVTKGETYQIVLASWLGQGLLLSDGQKWQKRRKLLTPSFHFRILEDFLITFNAQAQILMEILREDFSNGVVKDISPYVTRCTLDIIGETAMGKSINAQRDSKNPYVKAVSKACELTLYRFMNPHCWFKPIFYCTPTGREYRAALKTLHGFTDSVIKERKVSRSQSTEDNSTKTPDEDDIYWHGKRRLAFLDSLLEAQESLGEKELSDLDIRQEVDTFMFEGHDTTSASLSWTLLLLGNHPQFQAKVHEEMDGIFGNDTSRPITTKDLAEMKYLEMCIKEALRLYPSVPFFSRLTTSDLALDKDVTIPAGYNLILLTMPIHYNEEIYSNPKEFVPDRFLPENTAKRHPFAYVPFSAGPRNCIGQKFALMEEKVILANIFRNFRVEVTESMEKVIVRLEVITRPKHGVKIRLIPRQSV